MISAKNFKLLIKVKKHIIIEDGETPSEVNVEAIQGNTVYLFKN